MNSTNLKFIPVLFLLAARPGLSAGAWEDPIPQIGVVMQFDEHYSAVSVAEMQREIESIMSACAVHFEWRLLDRDTPREAFENLVITHFRGECSAASIPVADRRVTTLGMTHISEGEILPFSEVDCNKIRGFVAPEITKKSPTARDLLMGRAIGRVLAHEMYHMFIRTKRHGARGLAKRALSRSDLVTETLLLDSSEAAQIRERFHSRCEAPGGVHFARQPVPDHGTGHSRGN